MFVQKETIVWFDSNRSRIENNSSEKIDNTLDNISSNSLNERIETNLDKIERQIAVHIEHNDLKDESNARSRPIVRSSNRYSDSGHQSNAKLDYYAPNNAFNVQNISEEQFEEIFKDSDSNKSKDITKDVNPDKLVKSWTERRASEERPHLEDRPLNLVAKHSLNTSAKETTNTFRSHKAFSHMASERVFPYRDTYLKSLVSNVYHNDSIIAVETNDGDAVNRRPATTSPRKTANTSNSLIERIKYLTAKEENRAGPVSEPVPEPDPTSDAIQVIEADEGEDGGDESELIGAAPTLAERAQAAQAEAEAESAGECHRLVAGIEHRVSGESLSVALRWTELSKHVSKLCLYLSASDECSLNSASDCTDNTHHSHHSHNTDNTGFPSDKCSRSVDDCGKCSDSACSDCGDCLLDLRPHNSGDNRTHFNYLIGWYDCSDNRVNASLSYCHNFTINSDSDRTDRTHSGLRAVVIASATVVPIVCLALIAIACLWNNNRTAMKKFDW